MPTIKVPKSGKAKTAKTATAAKSSKTTKASTTKASTTAKKSASNGRSRRSPEEIDKLVPQFVKHLKAGGKMRELKQEHGFSDDGPIRQAMARAGYDSKGNKLELPDVKNTPKSVAAARKAGHPWYIIALVLKKTEAEVKAMAEKGGADVQGRVYAGGGRGR